MPDSNPSLAARRAELERRLAALSAEQRTRLNQRVDAPAPTGIQSRSPGAAIPLTFAQEVLWLLEQASPGMHGYNVPRAVRVRGTVDLDALSRALDTVLARHEILRTTFENTDGAPRQVVHPPRAVPIDIVDVQQLMANEREEETRRRVRELSRRPFDLARDLQLRMTVLRLAPHDHVLLLESHHIASDAWSRNILLREITAYYAAYREGRTVDLAMPAIQYGDYAVWQRERFRGPRLDHLLAYWRDQLRGAPAMLELPADHPRSALPSFEGDVRTLVLPDELRSGVHALSKRHGATFFMSSLAAFAIVLSRYAGQDDVVVGSPVAGRQEPELHGVIGYFANTLLLRARLDGDPTFVELLDRVRTMTLGAFDHQDVPYEKLIAELHEDGGGPAGSPQVLFTVHDADRDSLTFAGADAHPFAASRGVAKFDLALSLHEQPDGIRAAIEYRTDLYDAATVDRMLRHFATVLRQAIAEPSRHVSQFDLVTPEERALTCGQWNATLSPLPPGATLTSLIEAQVDRTPDGVALEWEDARGAVSRLTFADLNRAGDHVAEHLRRRGIGVDTGVAICAHRSPELVVAMLGVLKAGAFYVPVDPDYPPERISYMLGDSGVRLILAGPGSDVALAAAGNVEAAVVAVADIMTAAPIRSEAGARAEAGADDLAYVIYTSGSTGRPKGVMIPHRAVVNYLTWMRTAFGVTHEDAVLQKAPASFDASIWEFFLPLVTGARLVLARPGGHQDPEYILAAVTRHQITLLQLVPSQLRMVMETAALASIRAMTALRRLFLGGEALPAEVLRRFSAEFPNCPVTNLYGPTEATVYSTSWSVERGPWVGSCTRIGRPIANTSVYVLDSRGMIAPIGLPGELCIGGLGVAAGYLRRPELTAERFIRDPYSADADDRLYRTGDRARWTADGELEYLGRLDTQVKLRGFRIELGEIETVLAAHSMVSSAVAIVREDVAGDQRLVAYCIRSDEAREVADADATIAVHDHAGERLPEIMIPTAIVWMQSWPLNANGKLDRAALPAPASEARSSVIVPRSVAEARVAAAWATVLGRVVGMDDDFFRVGGHSLLALRVLSHVASETGVRLPLRAMFEARTIARLAPMLESAMTADREAPIPTRTESDAPLTHAQELLWLLQRAAPDSPAYNVAEQWDISGTIDGDALEAALRGLVARHGALRTRFISVDGTPRQSLNEQFDVVLERLDLSEIDAAMREQKVDEITTARANAAFDLGSGQLLRATLIRATTNEHRLVLVTHHIVFDGWSRVVLARDLAALYDAALEGRNAELPELPVRYADVAAWERNGPGAATMEEAKRAWADYLRGAAAHVVLPQDRPTPRAVASAAARVSARFDAELLSRLRLVAEQHDATLFMVLLAAFQTLLHRYGNPDDVLTATVAAGRTRREVEDLIGYFATTRIARTTFGAETSFSEIIVRVRQDELVASERVAVPLEAVVEASGLAVPPRVMFVLQNNQGAASTVKLGGATARPHGVSAAGAKVDLFLSMSEQNGDLRAAFQYRTDIFDEATARRMLEHLESLLQAVARDPRLPIDALPLLGARERALVLEEWNATASEHDADATIVSLLRDQARATPLAPAVVAGAETLTYAAVDARSDELARRLVARGVGAGSYVAVCMQRSADLIVALVGVLKSGAAYVPLDPEYPTQRISFMLDDTRASIVVTDGQTLSQLPSLAVGRTLVRLDEGGEDRGAIQLQADPSPADVAYVIYTSGSTGTPKGVLIEHRNTVALIEWARSRFSGAELAGVLAGTSVCFDLSVFEIFVPLCSGGTVSLVRDMLALTDARTVAALEARGKITLINTVPSVLSELLAVTSLPTSVQTVNLAGEPLQQSLVETLYASGSVTRVYDLYGPSEDTTYSTCALRRAGGRATIGRPIANSRAYVLDGDMRPVPIGVAGELYLAGAGVARGYLGRPELTTERFSEDPFTAARDTHPSRMYRTGDLVRWLSTGELEYLGRRDQQIKLRGFRIELGEIEAAVAGVNGVAACAAAVRELGDGERRLVAYVVTRPGQPVGTAELRAACRAGLPAYMMPSAFVTIDALPLTPSGKVDRKALPAPDATAFSSELPFAACETELERDVAAIWSEVLRVAPMGRTCNFFDMGGHSLMATRMVARVRDRLGRDVVLRTLFDNPVLADFASALERTGAVTRAATIAPIVRGAFRRAGATGEARQS